jgi:hypothetical protein
LHGISIFKNSLSPFLTWTNTIIIKLGTFIIYWGPMYLKYWEPFLPTPVAWSMYKKTFVLSSS